MPLAFGVCVALLLITATAFSTWQAMRASEARARTEIALKNSDEARVQAQGVSAYLLQTFRSIDPFLNGRDIRLEEILDRAVARLNSDFSGSLATKAELLHVLGQTYTELGLTTRAFDLLKEARSISQSIHGSDHPDTLHIKHIGSPDGSRRRFHCWRNPSSNPRQDLALMIVSHSP
jgi:hypothetical protein